MVEILLSLKCYVCEYLSSLSFEFWKGGGVKEFQMDLKGTLCVAELFQHLQCNFIFPLFLFFVDWCDQHFSNYEEFFEGSERQFYTAFIPSMRR